MLIVGGLGWSIVAATALWALIRALLMAKQAADTVGRDRAGWLVVLAARRLAAVERPAWGQAMLAELDVLDGCTARWHFALGCAWAALIAPRPLEVFGRIVRAVILGGVVACISVLLYGVTRDSDRNLNLTPASALVVAGVLLGYIYLATLLCSAANASAIIARRHGVLGGLVLGSLLLVGSTPIATSNGVRWVAPLLLTGGVAAGTAWSSRDPWSGWKSALTAGLIGSLMLCTGLLILTYAATDWFTADPTTIADLQDTWSPEKFQDIATYVIRENAESALLLLLGGPLISVVLGAIGGLVGNLLPHPKLRVSR